MLAFVCGKGLRDRFFDLLPYSGKIILTAIVLVKCGAADEHLTDAGLCAVTLECAYQGEPGLSYTQADYRRIGALLYRAIVFHPEDSAACASDGEKESGIAPPTKN